MLTADSSPPYDQVLAALAPAPGSDPDSECFACPVCGSSDSISLKRADDGRALVTCHSACGSGAEHPPRPRRARTRAPVCRRRRRDGADITTALGVPEEWLQEACWHDSPWYPAKGVIRQRVAIPYPHGTRYRNRLLSGSMKFSWKKGTKLATVGLYRGDELSPNARAAVLVEGESDAVVSRYGSGNLTVGLPGAGTMSEEHAAQLAHLDAIYAVIEPDEGGARLEASLRASSIAAKVRVVRPTDAAGLVCKDARACYLSDPTSFADRWNCLLSEAPTFEEINHAQELQRIHDAREAAGDLVHGDDLLDLLLKTYEQNGLVGEQHIAASTSLVFVSAPSGSPADVIVKGTSSGGKSAAVREVRAHFPPCFYINLTGASDKSLYYMTPRFAQAQDRLHRRGDRAGATTGPGERTR